MRWLWGVLFGRKVEPVRGLRRVVRREVGCCVLAPVEVRPHD